MQTWTGVVRRGASNTKSMDGWNGADHVLETADGERLILRPSEAISAEDLDALIDRAVTLHGEVLPDEPVAFDPMAQQMMQYPIGEVTFSPDGEVIGHAPAPRAGGVTVLQIAAHP